MFQDRAVRVGEDMFVTGQPMERGLREMQALNRSRMFTHGNHN